MRSSAGVGMTPPNVLGAPKPTSSVMMRSMLGAALGGTTRGAHQAFDCRAFSLITPPNFGSGGGSCLPLIVVVASGEPGTPVVCWADAAMQLMARSPAPKRMVVQLTLYAAVPARMVRSLKLVVPPDRMVTARREQPYWTRVQLGRSNVRFGSKADMCSAQADVRFTSNSGHVRCKKRCPLCAKSGHSVSHSITSSARASGD